MDSDTICQTVNNGLCTGCGTCVSLCPNNAIKLVLSKRDGIYVPKLNKDDCNMCGVCNKVCSGSSVEFDRLNLEIFGKKAENTLIGNYHKCYTGYSNDKQVRYNSSSGGLITQLLVFALEEKIIDGALVTRMSKTNPLESEPFIARTKEEIVDASKSKYCPVPANVALEKILKSKSGEKFAVVGLPCHIQGIRKAETISKKLKEKIVLRLGIFCNHTPNFWSIRLLLKRLNVKEEDIAKLDYRGDGRPGYLKIYKKTGEIIRTNSWSFIGSYFFYPVRCLMCSDVVCELADISFGDAWLPESSKDKIGTSIVVSRSIVGDDILQNMKILNKIKLDSVNPEKVVQSQEVNIHLKKKNISRYIKLFKVVPNYDNLIKTDIVDFLIALFIYMNASIFSNSFLRKFIYYFPSRFIKIYHIHHSLLSSIKTRKDFRN